MQMLAKYRQYFCMEVVKTVGRLHQSSLGHMLIMPSMFKYCENFELTFVDPEEAKPNSTARSIQIQSNIEYLAPEVYSEHLAGFYAEISDEYEHSIRKLMHPTAKQADMYSVGVILKKILDKMVPIDTQYFQAFPKTSEQKIREEEQLIFHCLVYRCLHENPFNRPKIDELLADLWIKNAPIRADKDMTETLQGIIAISGFQTE